MTLQFERALKARRAAIFIAPAENRGINREKIYNPGGVEFDHTQVQLKQWWESIFNLKDAALFHPSGVQNVCPRYLTVGFTNGYKNVSPSG